MKTCFRRLILIAFLATVALTAVFALSACNDLKTASDTLIVGTTTVINSLNRLASSGGDHGYNYTMLSATLAQVPLVYKAEDGYDSVLFDVTSPSGTKYVFKLKADFYWHDGTPVTARDTAFTLESTLGSTAEITVGDDAVSVEFESAKPTFLEGLTSVLLMPEHILQGETAATISDEKSVVGCGPFKFLSRNISAGTVEFEKFDKYPYADSVSLNKIVFRQFNSEDVMRLALKSGEIDMIWNYGSGLKADAVSDLSGADNINLISYAVKAVPKTLFFNNAKVNDARIKRAIRKAIDYDKIRRIFGTAASSLPREGFVAPTVFGYAQTAELTRDLEGAKALLSEAGYNRDNKYKFEILVRTDNNDTQYADLIKTDLEETGLIAVGLKRAAGVAQWQEYYMSGKHTASLASVTEAGYNFDAGYATRYLLAKDNYVMRDAFANGNPVCHGNIDIGERGSLTVFGKIREALSEAQNQDELKDAAKNYQNYIVEESPMIALIYDERVQAANKKIDGIRVDVTFGILNVQSLISLKKTV